MSECPDQKHHYDNCPHCGGQREGHINKRTRRGLVTMPLDCPDKARCEKEIIANYNFDDTPRP